MNLSPSSLNDDHKRIPYSYDIERVKEYLTTRKALVGDIESLRVLWLMSAIAPVLVDDFTSNKLVDNYFPAIVLEPHRRTFWDKDSKLYR